MMLRINLFFVVLSVFLANFANTMTNDGEEIFFDGEPGDETKPEEFSAPHLLLLPEFFHEIEFTIYSDVGSSFIGQEFDLTRNIPNKEFGLTFGCNTSYSRLAANFVNLNVSLAPINIGDWGCGQGFTSAFLLAVGDGNASIKMFDPVLESVRIANSTMHRVGQKYLKEKYRKYTEKEPNPSFTASKCSAEKPSATFMARENDLNIAFNIMHMMGPDQCDDFLKNIYKNTKKNGIAMIVVNRLSPDEDVIRRYQKRKEAGKRYPGFGIYNVSIIWEGCLAHSSASHIVHSPVSRKLAKNNEIRVGEVWEGRYPADPNFPYEGFVADAQKTKFGAANPFHQLAKDKGWKSYVFKNIYTFQNYFTAETIAGLVQENGFKVINVFGVNKRNANFYPASELSDDHESFLKADALLVIAEKN